MSESVYFFNDYQKLIRIVNEEHLLEVVQEKEITMNQEELMHDTLTVTTSYLEELKKAAYMAVKESDKSFSLYRIVMDSDPENKLSFTGINFAPDELDSYVVNDFHANNEPIRTMLQRLLRETEWTLGYSSNNLPTITEKFSYISIRDALKITQTHGCEIVFKYKISGNGIQKKWIEIHQRIGKYSNQRFTYGDKALSIVKEQDRNQVYTSLIGRGRGEDVGDGKGNRIEFDKVEWKKSKGKPLDKPKGQNWLEIPEMTKQYGIPLSNGDMRRREKVIIFDDEEDAEKLLQKTYQALIDYSRPLVQFKTEILDGDIIGNTVTIHRHDRKYHYETRIFKVKIDRLTGKIESSLGDNITNNIVKVASDLKGNVASLEEKKTTFYDSEEISKWQDDVLRGAKGGSIRIMNGIETEKSDSREPYQMVFMNGITVEKSKHFLIMNSSGISFVKGNLNNKPETAWTIDGELNADFIKGGTLEGVNVRTSSERDSQIRLQSNGTIVVYNKNKAEEMFWMGSAGNHSVVGLTHIEGYGFQIGTATNKEDRANNAIFEIPKEAKGSNKLYKLYGNGTLKGDIKIEGRLFLNGKEVIHGQGGGSGGGNTGGGTYPPDLTTDAEKRAWDIWAFLLANGYSKQATAGILGNIQGEVGSSMNPDTGQNGGPAYGLVQWDGSSYPLVGSQTTNGREYVQRLMAAARISEDYTTLSAQLKLISWCMYNGQWIGAVNPTSVEGFKVCNDIYTATFAFLKNFERAGIERLQERIDAGNYWYHKLKDLEASSGGFVKPIFDPITVTSEFGWRTSPITGAQELHNGIDLVNGNPNTPIYASAAGQVVVAANYPEWYGLYIVIKHSDGKYTGYAHNSQLLVSQGQTVKQGQQIGVMGTTGPSTGNHCHFQIMNDIWPNNNGFYNPRDFVKF
ncbi:phage tail spike protein [Enterococcus rivorum]|uniref:Peptidase M23 n=1 Tax=Enterococcus rivorum TaxID=762845 RepID=A0A1E5KVI5_9ENTE|nr:phage tail spike protein [Enterococcus rivorum]MBP2098316.1 phage minor structural protein [Enterococcus rivorum]OEH81892.1 hypothetical protein BCR26_03825 [Enterococcus rivorum]